MQRLCRYIIVFLGLTAPLLAQEAPPAQARAFALDNLTFALYHEIGHLLISEFSIPILGQEEDAADNIATMLLLAKQAEGANNALINSARGWMLSATQEAEKAASGAPGIATLYTGYASDATRAKQIACLLIGSKRETFASLKLEIGLGDESLETCSNQLGQVVRSWMRLRASFVSIGAPAAPITIAYETSPGFSFEATLIKDAELFEKSADLFLSNYALPRPIHLVAKSCGTANAYFDPANAELILCYELAARFLSLTDS